METKKIMLDGKEIEIFIENDIKTHDINELPEELEVTQKLDLDELRKQKLEDTIVINEVHDGE